MFAEGFTAATEYSTDMRSLAEDDIREAQRISGRLVRWRNGEMTVVAEGLVSPSSVAITDGRVFGARSSLDGSRKYQPGARGPTPPHGCGRSLLA
ncbi:MAG: hypothetical protein ACLFRT_09660 [Actinomycetota bacterium]